MEKEVSTNKLLSLIDAKNRNRINLNLQKVKKPDGSWVWHYGIYDNLYHSSNDAFILFIITWEGSESLLVHGFLSCPPKTPWDRFDWKHVLK